MNDDDDDLFTQNKEEVEAFRPPCVGGGFLFADALTRYHRERKDKAMIVLGEGCHTMSGMSGPMTGRPYSMALTREDLGLFTEEPAWAPFQPI